MRLPALLGYPVGRTAAAGRWYLAAASMSALLFLTLHFAVQADVQQQAKGVVERWAQQQGVTVADVHYRMMRGALTLEGFRFRIRDAELAADSLTLQGDITSFMNKQPRLSLLELRGIRLSTAGLAHDFWVSDGSYSPLFSRLWRSARLIVVEGGQIAVGNAGSFPHQTQRLELQRLRAVGAAGARRLTGDFRLAEGWLTVTAEESWADSTLPVIDATLEYGELSAEQVLPGMFGWQGLPGEISGRVQWHASVAEAKTNGSVRLIAADAGASVARLRWQGLLEQGGWQGELTAGLWPLATVADYLPRPAGRKLEAGLLSGVMRVAGGDDGWVLESDKLNADGLRLQQAEADGRYVWQAAAAEAKQLRLNVAERQLKIVMLDIDGVAAGFDLASQKMRDPGKWSIKVSEIGLHNFHASVHLADDRWLNLPALKGRATWKRDGWQLALHDDQVEGWQLSGMSSLKSELPATLSVELDEAPLVRLRPLLPPLFRSGDAELEGTVSARLQLSGSRQGWQLGGEAQAVNVHFGLFGDNWFADQIKLDLAGAGGEFTSPVVEHIDIRGWRYHSPLVPLPLPDQQQLPMARIDTREWFGRWQVEKVSMSEGRLAVGQSSSVWLDHIAVELSGIAPGVTSEVLLRGAFDEGTLYMKGRIGFSAVRPLVKSLKVSVRDALPFFGREWMQHSGMPPLQRGRLYADLTIGEQNERWQGTGYLRLQHGALEQVAVPVDQLLGYTGYNGYELFTRLSDKGRIRLKVPIEGEGALLPVLGQSLVKTLRRSAETASVAESAQLVGQPLSQLRLHGRQRLSHNERVRLRSVIAQLQEKAGQVVELVPQLGERELNDETLRQVRYTQKLAADFMEERGIRRERIYPVWPGPQHRDAGGSSGILLRAVSPAN